MDGEKIGYYLADVCREAREKAGRNQNYIAGQIGSGIDKVKNFELQKIRWSPDTDLLVATYAELASVDPVDLWQRAIDRWKAAQDEDHDDQDRHPPAHPPKAPKPSAPSSRATRHRGAGS